ncbi:MAG: hypothetical protein JXA21_16225 [Anaerolineae bacterium]|nr:hypothetical protein [Anaerolineae bacterium]
MINSVQKLVNIVHDQVNFVKDSAAGLGYSVGCTSGWHTRPQEASPNLLMKGTKDEDSQGKMADFASDFVVDIYAFAAVQFWATGGR